MSYLDLPRINFSGTFRASPSTINNTPNNYNPNNYEEGSLKPENIELYWEPSGDGIFDLLNCNVTTVEAPADEPGVDSLLGASVAAVYAAGNHPKMVDLDPMQQNGSELWGLTMMFGDFGGAYVQGTFEPVAFNGIWGISQGPNSPQNSASGAASYVSTLTNLKWNVGDSAALKALQALSPKRLSIRMVVSAHNNAPLLYKFTQPIFDAMVKNGVPDKVVQAIQSLQDYVMNLTPEGKPTGDGAGVIPTPQYVNYLLKQLLGQSVAEQYGPIILSTAKLPYAPWSVPGTKTPLDEQPLYAYNYGKLVGSVGPCADDEPAHVVPARMLAPNPAPKRTLTAPQTPTRALAADADPLPLVAGWWATAKLDETADSPSLTIDLANSLPVPLPGRPLWVDKLGILSLAYYTVSGDTKTYTTFVESIPYADTDFIDKKAGMLVVTDVPKEIANLPIALRSTVMVDGVSQTATLLEENAQGLSLRADQFIFRMNPGMQTTETFSQGETNNVDFYARRFGRIEGTEELKVILDVLRPSQATYYTLSTLGTGGTNGITEANISVPEGKLIIPRFAIQFVNGKITLPIRGDDPGNPRGFVDGQVYFLTYDFSPKVEGFHQDPNDLVSVQIYQQTPIIGTPTWKNGIGEMMRQYGMLYPIMGAFELWTYEGVKTNHEKIERVLRTDMSLPLHMPVTRDMSAIRRDLVLGWFAAGMPES